MSQTLSSVPAQPGDQPLPPMPGSHRQAVRALLVAEAAGDVTARARRSDPAPVVHRGRARPLTLGVAGLLAVTVLALLLLAADPTAPPSYASWTAVPVAAPPPTASQGEVTAWASRCTDLGVGGVAVEGLGRRPSDATRREVLADRRGGFTFCVDISTGSGTARDPLVALSGLRGSDGMTRMWTTVSDRPFARPVAGSALVLGGDVATPPAEPATDPDVRGLRAYQLYGLAAADVGSVTAVLTNGLRVQATLRSGIWGLWWPMERGDPTGVRLEVRTADATVATAAVDLALPG